MGITFADIMIIVFVLVGIVLAALYFLNKWAAGKMDEQQSAIARTKQTTTIFIIDKQSGRIKDANFPKAVMEQMPWYAKALKMYFVKAKVGPQIFTLLCEKNVYEALPVKKNVKVELAGIYIISMKGMKSKEEMKQLAKAKKAKEKEKEKEEKQKG